MRKIAVVFMAAVAALGFDSCVVLVPHGESYHGKRYISPYPHNYSRRTHVVHPGRAHRSGQPVRYAPRR